MGARALWGLGWRLGWPSPATHAGLSHTTRQCTHSSRHMLSPLCLVLLWFSILNPLVQATTSLGGWGSEPQATATRPDGKDRSKHCFNQEGKAKGMAAGSLEASLGGQKAQESSEGTLGRWRTGSWMPVATGL